MKLGCHDLLHPADVNNAVAALFDRDGNLALSWIRRFLGLPDEIVESAIANSECATNTRELVR